jgi:hypothetical protein
MSRKQNLVDFLLYLFEYVAVWGELTPKSYCYGGKCFSAYFSKGCCED